jgi:hypothetical protein
LTQPTLMFCVGATKAGTSWLYRYLHLHEQCSVPKIKETHFFDTLDFNDQAYQTKIWAERVAVLSAQQQVAVSNKNQWKVDNLQLQIEECNRLIKMVEAGEEGLPAYLEHVFMPADDMTKVVADITPAYGLLSAERLEMMTRLTPDVKVVFLMRDPIDRLWSHVRMIAGRSNHADIGFEKKCRRVLKRATHEGTHEHMVQRGDYAHIVQKLKSVVPAKNLHIEFFEQLLTEDGVRRLCDFLGVSYMPADLERKVHEGKSLKMDENMRGWAADFMAPQYAFAKETFGALPVRWQANMARVN